MSWVELNQVQCRFVQRFSGWLSKNCDENPRMRIIFNHQKCAHARILVAFFQKTAVKTAYSALQVGCPCAKLNSDN